MALSVVLMNVPEKERRNEGTNMARIMQLPALFLSSLLQNVAKTAMSQKQLLTPHRGVHTYIHAYIYIHELNIQNVLKHFEQKLKLCIGKRKEPPILLFCCCFVSVFSLVCYLELFSFWGVVSSFWFSVLNNFCNSSLNVGFCSITANCSQFKFTIEFILLLK